MNYRSKYYTLSIPSLFIVLLCSLAVLSSCGDKTQQTETVELKPLPESFSFFDLNVNSIYDGNLRDNLRAKLGSDALETRTTIDLSFNYPEFLQQHVPALDELNKRLNYRPEERIEHNTTKLTYRHSRNKDIPFEIVTVIFSNYSHRPLLIRVKSRNKDQFMIDTLKERYGEPEIIQWTNRPGISYIWRMHSDILIASSTANKIGNLFTEIMICYTRNLEPMIIQEEQEVRQAIEKRKESGSTAF